MKSSQSRKWYVTGIAATLTAVVISAAVMGLYPVCSGTMGIVAVLSMVLFSLCCSRWIENTFEAETGIMLSKYYQKLYGGYWRDLNQKAAQGDRVL